MRYKPDVGSVYDSSARAEMLRLSVELHGGQYAPCRGEYDSYSSKDAPTVTFISKRYPGGWKVFCEACGLVMAEYSYYYAEARKRREQWEAMERPSAVEVGKERDRMEKDERMGLCVRDVPRVDVWKSPKDGRWYQGLAWEVR